MYFATKAKQVAILVSSAAADLGRSVDELLKQKNITLPFVDISHSLTSPQTLEPEDIVISSDHHLNDNSAGIVIFTSGTTGASQGIRTTPRIRS